MKFCTIRILAVLVMLTTAVTAGESEVSFRNGHALGHAYLQHHWTQVKLRVANSGDEGQRMKAVLSVRDGLKTVKYSRPFYLPAGCERSVWFCSQRGARQMNPVSIYNDEGAEVASGDELSNILTRNRIPCLVVDEGRVVPPMSMYLGRRNTVQLDRSEVMGYRQARREKESLTGGNIRHTATLSTRLPEFPDQWAGLDSIGAVATGELDYQNWRPSQVRALKTWIQSGGVLLLFPGESYPTIRGSAMEELMPVEIFGKRHQKRVRLEGETESWSLELDEYITVLESETIGGQTILSNGQMPMVVRRRVGMGSVYFFAFDGSVMEQWDQSGTLYARIFRGNERLKPLAQTGLLGKGPRMINDVVGAEVAPRSFVVASLGGFLLIAAVSLAVAHYYRRTELAWAVIIPVGMVIGFFSYRVGQSYRAEVGRSINEIAVLRTGSDVERAFRSAIIGVHSESTLEGELRAGSKQSFLTAASSGDQKRGQITTDFIQVLPRYAAKNLSIQPGSLPRYVVNAPVRIRDGIDVQFQLGPRGLEGTVHNRTSIDLEHGLLAFNSYPFVPAGLQSVESGTNTRCVLNEESARSRGDFATEALLGSASLTRKRIVRHLFTTPKVHMYSPWTRRLFLLAWPERDFIGEQLTGVGRESVTKRSSALFCVEARVTPPPSGQRVVIPRAFSIPAVQPARTNRVFRLSHQAGRSMARDAKLLFYMPRFASNVAVEKAALRMSVEAYGYDLNIQGVEQDGGKRVPLTTRESPSGRIKVDIPRAGRFQNMEQGILELAVKARRTRQPGSVSSAGQNRRMSWSCHSMSVRLEGRAR